MPHIWENISHSKMKNLVIVESPAKAKTIEKFLGPDFKVLSSYGHIRDLQKKDFSVNIDSDFSPIYEIPADKKELVKKLKSEASKADVVWLASDEDREGEAIAWHLAEVLGLDPNTVRRIVFHEITKPAILHAIENPRTINMDRVNAQQARRVLDRIVGFELSPVLWRKIKPSLSAGRVQSVAVRLICEKEKEIEAFKSESFYRANAIFIDPASGSSLRAELSKRIADEKSASDFLHLCDGASFKVRDIVIRPVKRSPAPPFTTSTLQQEASRKLGFSVNQTMVVAQELYEAGKITYMRTDSTNLSELARADIAKEIKNTLGEKYLQPRHYHTKSKGAQEAHEAIRPTYISSRTIDGTPRQQRLYELIWKRAVASQMADAQLEKTHIDIETNPNPSSEVMIGSINITALPEGERRELVESHYGNFKAEGEVVKFDGFMRLYQVSVADDSDSAEHSTDGTAILPPLSIDDRLNVAEVSATERFTMPPARFSEATLVKKMEDLGIGRPSTYAPTIETIIRREYVKRGEKEGVKRDFKKLTLADGVIRETILAENTGSEKGKLIPTDIGMVVNEFLTQSFPDILDYNFTAKIEEKFDDIAEGKLPWKEEMADFYSDFHPEIEKVSAMKTQHKIGERILGTDPKSGRQISVKIGRFGPVVQIGEATDEEKPVFASLLEGQSIATITLDEALKLFELPRTLGDYNGETISAAIGRFGPYVKYGKNTFVSIPKDLTPQTITLGQAIDLIEAKKAAEANKLIKEFDEMPEVQVLNGRYGPYISYLAKGAKKAVNYKIPKEKAPEALTIDDIKSIMEAQDSAPKRTSSRKKS